MGKTESEISEWISGERNMTIDTLSDFENALGISLLNIHSERTQRIPSQTVINVHVGNSSWIAHYHVPELQYKGEWKFWQHTDCGQLDGIKGDVDCNIFNGSLQELTDLTLKE